MEENILDNAVPEDVSPALLRRHIEQLRARPNSRLLYHTQAHEIYMYAYFRNVALASTSAISVNGVKGHTVGVVDHGDVTLVAPVDDIHFYSILRHAPIPFFFVPDIELFRIRDFCRGAFSFESMGRRGVMMDLDFAAGVGVDFIGIEYLLSGELKKYYIGFIYEDSQ